MTEGFRSTGLFEPVAAVEQDRMAAATYVENFGDHLYLGDVADWVEGSLPAAEVVVGGPPCQGFSLLGRRDPDDPRNAMWRHYVSAVVRIRPAFFVIENVPQFLRSQEYEGLVRETSSDGELHRYAIESHILNARDYGVAQSRKRAIIIGRLRELFEVGPPPTLPGMVLGDVFPTWLDPRVGPTEPPWRTTVHHDAPVPGSYSVRDLHFAPLASPLALARYRSVPPGGSRFDLPNDLKTPGWRKNARGAGDVLGRLRWEKPAVTIRTEFFKPEKGRFLHPTEDRPITHAEAALIQGFPESFRWCGTKAAIARQIGNAVPVPLARSLANHIADRFTVGTR